MRTFLSLWRQSADFSEADAALDRAREGVEAAEGQRVRAADVARRAKKSRAKNHFSEGMAAALRAPLRSERTHYDRPL